MFIQLDEAIDHLKRGEVVAIPTETVYGLAASLSSPTAIEEIFRLKGRPGDNPLIVHIASLDQLQGLITAMPDKSALLIEKFWPGSLTIIFPANIDQVPSLARAGLNTLGIRMPQHELALALIDAVGPIVAPSANISGRPSSTTPEHVAEDFGDILPILSGGVCSQGMESTIIAHVEGSWKILRLGAVSAEELEEVLGEKVWNDQEQPALFDMKKPLCPGQKYRHYAPSCHLVLGLEDYSGSPSVVIGFDGKEYPGAKKIFRLGDIKNPKSIEKNLYANLRALDEEGIQQAWVDGNFDSQGPLRTIFERLKKASQI